MKLNKYIYSKMLEVEYEALPWKEEDIEQWIIDWYMDTFQEVGCDGEVPKPRGPPMWLAGPRWYDRRKRIIAEAKEAEEKVEKEKVEKEKAKEK